MHLGGLVAARRAPQHPARVSHPDDHLVELLADRTADDRGVRRSRGGWRETQLKAPIPTIRAFSAWQRRSDRSHELELAAALEDGGGTGKDRGGDLVVEGQLSKIRKYSAAAGWPWLVDEAETTEVEMTHE
jgi:hypothetical protein